MIESMTEGGVVRSHIRSGTGKGSKSSISVEGWTSVESRESVVGEYLKKDVLK